MSPFCSPKATTANTDHLGGLAEGGRHGGRHRRFCFLVARGSVVLIQNASDFVQIAVGIRNGHLSPKDFRVRGDLGSTKQRGTMVENRKKHRQNSHSIFHCPTIEGVSEVSGASKRANGRASGPVLQSVFLAVIDQSERSRARSALWFRTA